MCQLAEQEGQGGIVASCECISSRLMLLIDTTSDSGETFFEALNCNCVACYRQLIALLGSSVQLLGSTAYAAHSAVHRGWVVFTPREPVCEKARNKNGSTSHVASKKVLDLSITDHVLFRVTRELSYVDGIQHLLSCGRHDV